ncbi:calmodulin-like protein 6 [Malania oleifera]|uniref:calmodulin-like protein 6 n=1 Tax=Malania oleifera TaxID=397392 RepID=UPI0025AE8B50|nr:calmodulin-like protein 6 [Malania oleifera]
MLSIAGACYRFIGDVVQAIRVLRSSSTDHLNANPPSMPHKADKTDELMVRALTAVFGMDANGRIKKERAHSVVKKLGLISNEEDDKHSFDLMGSGVSAENDDELGVEEVLGGLEGEGDWRRMELLHKAFAVFDLDGNGFIEAEQLKRVLECLGLDKGWDIGQIEKMVMLADLNLNGKVDFREFETMMR